MYTVCFIPVELYEACKKGNLAQVKELLQIAHDGLNSSVYEGRSLLMWLVYNVK